MAVDALYYANVIRASLGKPPLAGVSASRTPAVEERDQHHDRDHHERQITETVRPHLYLLPDPPPDETLRRPA